MDLAKALAELKQQRDNIDQAIMSLERLAADRPRGRGRPPGRRAVTKKHPVHAVGNGGMKGVPD
ncbi:MAG TPA: hypothetical protein VMU80_24880 [Bryobacteraceae bacterium]|nr:hypothetical protein [Bryobacteraceae bacterium]